jgi:hypothetical protein
MGTIVTALAIAAGVGATEIGEVVASFPAPAAEPTDLAYGGGYLYCYCATPPYLIWKINPANGQVVASYGFPFMGAATAGLAYDGSFFWVGNRDTDYLYRFKLDGTVLSSFKTTWDFGYGLGWAGLHLWGTEQRNGRASNYFYKMRVDGFVLQSFVYYYAPYDVTWDGGYLWACDYNTVSAESRVVALTVAGPIKEIVPAPAASARGIVYDGAYLWVSTLADGGRLWKINGAGVGLTPASLGRVKALYR